MLGLVTQTARKGFAHPAVLLRCILFGITAPLVGWDEPKQFVRADFVKPGKGHHRLK